MTAFALGCAAQAGAYLFLLTPRYPTSDPKLAEPYADLRAPVRIVVDDDLARPRLTVLFRLFLAIPHFVWILLWSIAVFFVGFVAWILALVLGRVPDPLHRFLAAYIRYATHLLAFVGLVGRRFPGFTGRAGSYGIDIEIDPPTRQNRWKTLFRFFLAIPAFILASALEGVAFVIALFAWWYALVTGRMPGGCGTSGLLPALLGTDLRVLPPRHEPVPVRRADPARAAADVGRAAADAVTGAAARRRRLLRAAFAALVFAALAIGRCPTAVPDDLALPAVDVDALFGADFVAEAKRYERVFYVLWALAQIALLLTLWVYSRRGAALARESSAGPIGTGTSSGCSGWGSSGSSICPSGSRRTGGRDTTTNRSSATSTGCSRTGPCSEHSSSPSASPCSS